MYVYKAFCELLSTHTVLNVLSHIIVILFLIVYSEDGLNILKGVFKKKVVYYLKKKEEKKSRILTGYHKHLIQETVSMIVHCSKQFLFYRFINLNFFVLYLA